MFDDTREKLLDHLKTVIKYAKLLGARLIVFGSPKNRSYVGEYDEDKKEIALNFFKNLNEMAQYHKITVCIEPNAREYGCNFLWNLRKACKTGSGQF